MGRAELFASIAAKHRCATPELHLTGGRQLWWECGVCGRVWHPVYAGSLCWWGETKGPTVDAYSGVPENGTSPTGESDGNAS